MMAPQTTEVNTIYKRAWREQNREQQRETDRASYRRNISDRRVYQREWKRAHREEVREYKYLQLFGITIADYDRMFQSQSGKCAICRRPPYARRLDVDHCHITLRVRGLLCHRCNRALAFFSDDPVRMRAAAEYVSA